MSRTTSPVSASRPVWFYLIGSQQVGPVTQQQLLQLSAAGQITPETLVWRDGFDNWVAYSDARVGSPTAAQRNAGFVLSYAKGEDEPTNIFGWWWHVVSQNYASMRGRARRKEFWSFVLVNIIIVAPLGALAAFLGESRSGLSIIGIIFLIAAMGFYLGIIIPYICAVVRRLHDSGLSGWCFFISFIPYIGGLILLFLLVRDSEAGTNRFGPNPKSALRGRE